MNINKDILSDFEKFSDKISINEYDYSDNSVIIPEELDEIQKIKDICEQVDEINQKEYKTETTIHSEHIPAFIHEDELGNKFTEYISVSYLKRSPIFIYDENNNVIDKSDVVQNIILDNVTK